MVLRCMSSAYLAEDVHASFRILCELAYVIGTTTLCFCANMCLFVASMIFHSRMMYVDNGTGQLSLYFTVLLVPRRSHYTLSCVRREIRLYDSKLNFVSLLNFSLSIYLLYYVRKITLGCNGHITSLCTSLCVTILSRVQCFF